MCEKTRNYHSDRSHNRLSDVYHGKIWSEFLKFDRCDFLLSGLCYGVMLIIDRFQPFDHYTYSLGVIYLVIMNLPRNQRYKWQNVIIVGIIPGPHEPPLTINSKLSNFARSSLPVRTNSKHRKDVDYLMKNRKSLTAESRIESELGCRYSVLLKLPCFDPVRMTLMA